MCEPDFPLCHKDLGRIKGGGVYLDSPVSEVSDLLWQKSVGVKASHPTAAGERERGRDGRREEEVERDCTLGFSPLPFIPSGPPAYAVARLTPHLVILPGNTLMDASTLQYKQVEHEAPSSDMQIGAHL